MSFQISPPQECVQILEMIALDRCPTTGHLEINARLLGTKDNTTYICAQQILQKALDIKTKCTLSTFIKYLDITATATVLGNRILSLTVDHHADPVNAVVVDLVYTDTDDSDDDSSQSDRETDDEVHSMSAEEEEHNSGDSLPDLRPRRRVLMSSDDENPSIQQTRETESTMENDENDRNERMLLGEEEADG